MYEPSKAYEAAVAALEAEAKRIVAREGPAACRSYLRRLGALEARAKRESMGHSLSRGETEMTFTRDQIAAINIGTMISLGIDGRFGKPTPVVEITARRDDINGKLFVLGYREYGENARMSFSIKEGDEVDARHYRIA